MFDRTDNLMTTGQPWCSTKAHKIWLLTELFLFYSVHVSTDFSVHKICLYGKSFCFKGDKEPLKLADGLTSTSSCISTTKATVSWFLERLIDRCTLKSSCRKKNWPKALKHEIGTTYSEHNINVNTVKLSFQLTLGRAEDNDVPLSDSQTVSRRHAHLRKTTYGWTIEDLVGG